MTSRRWPLPWSHGGSWVGTWLPPVRGSSRCSGGLVTPVPRARVRTSWRQRSSLASSHRNSAPHAVLCVGERPVYASETAAHPERWPLGTTRSDGHAGSPLQRRRGRSGRPAAAAVTRRTRLRGRAGRAHRRARRRPPRTRCPGQPRLSRLGGHRQGAAPAGDRSTRARRAPCTPSTHPMTDRPGSSSATATASPGSRTRDGRPHGGAGSARPVHVALLLHALTGRAVSPEV
jgi:hypothetical protein